jgi:hypothetical protein
LSVGSSRALRFAGALLIVFGLFVTALAFAQGEIGEGGLVIVFPFVLGGVSGPAALVLTLIFAGIFVALSFLPWLLFRGRPGWGEYAPLDFGLDPGESEEVDYMITLELPDHIRRRVLIEGDGGVLWLRSGADGGFVRRYSLPEGFEVGEFEYEYEGSYLLLKLRLRRSA